VLANLGQLQEALSAYENALALNPALPDLQLSLAQCYAQQQQLPLAWPHFEAAAQLNPALPALQRIWGLHLLDAGEVQEGLNHLHLAQQQGDTHPSVALGVAVGCYRQGALAEALKGLRSALIQHPTHAGLSHALGVVLARQGHLLEAKQAFEEALQADPQLHHAKVNRALMFLEQPEKELHTEALRQSRALYREQPTTPWVVTPYALALWATGDVEAAEEKLQAVLAEDPTQTGALAALLCLKVHQAYNPKLVLSLLQRIDDTYQDPPPLWLWAQQRVNAYLAQHYPKEEAYAQRAECLKQQLWYKEPWLEAEWEALTTTKPLEAVLDGAGFQQPWRLWLLGL
jgi:tetratricopeptide (TPR) repeat protein